MIMHECCASEVLEDITIGAIVLPAGGIVGEKDDANEGPVDVTSLLVSCTDNIISNTARDCTVKNVLFLIGVSTF